MQRSLLSRKSPGGKLLQLAGDSRGIGQLKLSLEAWGSTIGRARVATTQIG